MPLGNQSLEYKGIYLSFKNTCAKIKVILTQNLLKPSLSSVQVLLDITFYSLDCRHVQKLSTKGKVTSDYGVVIWERY